MRAPIILAVALLSLASWLLLAARPLPASEHSPDERTIALLRADYLEDEQTGRRLADLTARLIEDRKTGQGRLEVHIDATGPRIDPAMSYRGIHGANHITARDLSELVATQRLAVVSMRKNGNQKRRGTILAGTPQAIPERRLEPDGTLLLRTPSRERFVTQITAQSPELEPGVHEVFIESRGVPRLRVDVQITRPNNGRVHGKILKIVCLGGHNVRTVR